jgi:hypothetical protein
MSAVRVNGLLVEIPKGFHVIRDGRIEFSDRFLSVFEGGREWCKPHGSFDVGQKVGRYTLVIRRDGGSTT